MNTTRTNTGCVLEKKQKDPVRVFLRSAAPACYASRMSRLSASHDEIRSKVFHLADVHQSERETITVAIMRLSESERWYPDELRRELRSLQSAGKVSERARHAIEKLFFPGHVWS